MKADAELKIAFTLAFRLQRPITEILDLPYEHFHAWIAYLRMIDARDP